MDGRPSPIYKAMGAFRAVPVPAGEHTITFRYISGAFRAGAAFSLFTLIGLVMLASGGLTVKRLRRGKGPRTRVA